jgi:hypothetical protein
VLERSTCCLINIFGEERAGSSSLEEPTTCECFHESLEEVKARHCYENYHPKLSRRDQNLSPFVAPWRLDVDSHKKGLSMILHIYQEDRTEVESGRMPFCDQSNHMKYNTHLIIHIGKKSSRVSPWMKACRTPKPEAGIC